MIGVNVHQCVPMLDAVLVLCFAIYTMIGVNVQCCMQFCVLRANIAMVGSCVCVLMQ